MLKRPTMKDLNYYTEYTDAEHRKHYAVHSYNTISKIVTAMRDIKF